MKRQLHNLVILFLLTSSICSYAQRGIGTTNPHSSAILELKSTNKGFLLPRMSKIERDVIVSPAEGLMIYCTDCTVKTIQFYDGTNWKSVIDNNVVPEAVPGYGLVRSPITNKIWLDRNLGATRKATSLTDEDAYGHYYQWGRNDAFTEDYNTADNIEGPVTSTVELSSGGMFIYRSGGNNWLTPDDHERWNSNGYAAPVGSKVEANDPCPSGFRVPTRVEFENEVGGFTNASEVFASHMKLPLVGHRESHTGGAINIGTSGLYWTSTGSSNGKYATALSISSTFVNFVTTFPRPSGNPIRCIQE